MLDKGHCMMNMEDEDEYLDFYDFSKTYENHPLLIKDDKKAIEPVKESAAEAEEADSWSDCDEASLASESFEEIDTSGVPSSKGFTIEESKLASTTEKDFSIVEGTHSEATDAKFKLREAKGKTREEVFLGLDIKRAELLPSGEVLLGNGKLMGVRKWHYAYK